jgi:hypothetical protein
VHPEQEEPPFWAETNLPPVLLNANIETFRVTAVLSHAGHGTSSFDEETSSSNSA